MNFEKEIKNRLEKITPYPWRVMASPKLPPMVCSVAGDCGEDCPAHEHCHRCITDVIHKFEDADFIAHAPQDIAALVAEVERLRIVVDTYSRVTLDDEGEIQQLRTAIKTHRHRLRLEARADDRELWAVLDA